MKVLHVISGLGVGGAENFLLRLISTLPASQVAHHVVSLGRDDALLERFRAAGIPVTDLMLRPGASLLTVLRAVPKLLAVTRAFQPDLIQGWMNHGNLFSWVARTFACRSARLIWSIRQTLYDVALERRGTQITIKAQVRVSANVDAVVSNSHLGLEQHVKLGIRGKSRQVIPNGFDVEALRPRPELREPTRAALGLASSDFVIAMIARYHTMKEYETFVKAFAIVARQYPDARALCIGKDVELPANGLPALVAELGIQAQCLLLGGRSDVSTLLCAVDVVCLTSSWGEGFPNVIGEAMACGIPCVVTPVGDAPRMVGSTGLVVEARNPEATAAALVEMRRMPPAERHRLGLSARSRVVQEYSITVVADRYLALYNSLLRNSAVASGYSAS